MNALKLVQHQLNEVINMRKLTLIMTIFLGACAGGPGFSNENTVTSGNTANAECTHIVKNGTYSDSIDSWSYPAGSLVCAESDGGVVFTGDFNPRGFNMRGFVVTGTSPKSLTDGVFERMSFIGGPSCGNEVNTYSGGNTVIRNSVFFGEGGRYLFIAYQVENVHLENVVFRVDGGWGETNSCNEYEPNAALVFYDSSSASCDGCIEIDTRITAAENSENLGGIGVNSHSENLCFDIEFRNGVSYNAKHFWAEGNGRCDPVFDNMRGDFNFNLRGTATISNSSGATCNSWNGAVEKVESNLESGNCSSTGRGAAIKLNNEFLNDPRWRHEMCEVYSQRKDGWCAQDKNLSEYISQ